MFAFFEAKGMKDSAHMQGFPGRIALVCSDSLDRTSQCVTSMRSRECLNQSVLGISSRLFLSHCCVGSRPCPARASCSCTRLIPRRWRWHHRCARRVAAMSQAVDDSVSAASALGATAKARSAAAAKKKAKTKQVRARLEEAGGARGSYEKAIVTMQEEKQGPAASAAASSSGARADPGSDSDSDAPMRVVLRVAVDCDIGDLFAESHTAGSRFLAEEMLRDGYDVTLKARGRTNPNSRTPRPSVLTLKGGREQMRGAYAALFEFVKPTIREKRLLSTPEDTFRQFPLPPEDEALTRPGGKGKAAPLVFVDPAASADEVITETVGGITVTRAGVDRLSRETTLKLSLQDHLLPSSLEVPMTVPVAPSTLSPPHRKFTDQELLQFRRACLLALERVQAHAQ